MVSTSLSSAARSLYQAEQQQGGAYKCSRDDQLRNRWAICDLRHFRRTIQVEQSASHCRQCCQAECECDPQHHNALTGTRIVIVAHDPRDFFAFELSPVHICIFGAVYR